MADLGTTAPQWFAWSELAFGLTLFIWGLRSRPFRYPDGQPVDFRPRTMAPGGLMFAILGITQFAQGFAPVALLVSVELVAVCAVLAWGFRLQRAWRRELRRITEARRSPPPTISPLDPR